MQDVYEDCARWARVEAKNGNPSRTVNFGKEMPAVWVFDTVHCPEEIMEFAGSIGAVYEGCYIIVFGDGNPHLYTSEEVKKLFHP